MNLDPRAESNNLHHTATYRSEEDWWEDNFGKGKYDVDFIGYPGELPIVRSGKKYATYGHATHGYSKNSKFASEYRIWKHMRGRCNNPNDKSYRYYGARGIKVHKDWDSFVSFLNYMGRRPGTKYSIDRIDNNGNYEPGNVRWATALVQQNNKRRNGPSSITVTHAIKIRELRDKGWKQKALAELFMLSKQTISDIVRGKHYKVDYIYPESERPIMPMAERLDITEEVPF